MEDRACPFPVPGTTWARFLHITGPCFILTRRCEISPCVGGCAGSGWLPSMNPKLFLEIATKFCDLLCGGIQKERLRDHRDKKSEILLCPFLFCPEVPNTQCGLSGKYDKGKCQESLAKAQISLREGQQLPPAAHMWLKSQQFMSQHLCCYLV